jgi:hypothetical protein
MVSQTIFASSKLHRYQSCLYAFLNFYTYPSLAHQKLPQPLPIDKVPPNNIDKPVITPQLTQQLTTSSPRLIYPLPLLPDTECLLEPAPKTDRFDNSRRDNFLARESTPSHRIHAIFLTSFELASGIACEVGDLFVRVELGFEGSE